MPAAKEQRTQKQRRAESDKRLTASAIELFARHGYHKTSLEQVGEKAGYTPALIIRRFGSKKGLLQAALRKIFDDFMQGLGPVLEADSATDSLLLFIERYLREITTKNTRLRPLYILTSDALSGVPEVLENVIVQDDEFRTIIAGILQNGVDQGEFHTDTDVETATVLVIGLVRGITMQALVKPKAVDVEKLTKASQAAVLSLLQKK